MTLSKDRLPYPGLRAFAREESDLFFGRESCVDAMVDRLATTRFLAVLGASGSGKSSLVRTGLIDALDLGLHPSPRPRWKIADLHPGGQPLRNLAAALLETKNSPYESMDVDFLGAFLRNGPRSIVEWVSGGNLASDANLLILVDQFEELFRYSDYAQREEAEAFVSLLLESTTNVDVSIHVVLTMRSEFLGACALIPGLAERINAGLYLTPRMTREECRAAIEGPANVIGFTIQPVLVNRLLNDLAAFAPWEDDGHSDHAEQLSRRSDQLPIMQHVLNRLWVRAADAAQGSAVELKLAEYEQIGGLSGALDAHGAEVLAGLNASQSRRVEDVFRALVSGTSVASAVRRPARLRELVELAGGARDDVVAVVEAFRAPGCNFVRTSESSFRSDMLIVDISHESLIRQWTPLREWLHKEARDDAAWRRLTAAQERYSEGQGDLLTGLDLDSIAAWWESAKPTPIWASRHGGQFETAATFLQESRQAQQARVNAERQRQLRERNRLRRQRAALAVALIAALGLVGLALYQRSSAKQQETKANEAARSALALRNEAEAQRAEAARQAKVASEALETANTATVRAERGEEAAREQKGQAEEQKRQAEEQRRQAEEQKRQLKLVTDFLGGNPTLKEAVETALAQIDPAALEQLLRELSRISFKPNPALSTDEAGIAIYGYDPVAYFGPKGLPVAGKVNFYLVWNGGIWLFSNAENRERFRIDPRHYEPAYGGFCAFCLATGHKYHGDPRQWVIHGNRLYLHAREDYRQLWLKDPDSYIRQAEDQWSTVSDWRVESIKNIAISDQIVRELKARQKEAEPQYTLAQNLAVQKKWEEAAEVLENLLAKYPRHLDGLKLAAGIYHERLFRYDRAYELNAQRLELGSSGELDFVENHLTTGRFETCAKRAAFEETRGYERDALLMLSGIQFACRAGGQVTEGVAAARDLRTKIAGLGKVRWTFDGTKHFLGTDPRFAAKAREWVALFEALEEGNEKKALASISSIAPE